MPFISAKLDDVSESEAVPEGEYPLRIIKAKEEESKKGEDMAVITFKIEDKDYPTAAPVKHWFLSPEKAEPDVAHMRKLEWKRFCTTLGVDTDIEVEDLVGETLDCLLIQEEADDGNVYNRLRLPRLKE